MPTLADIGLVPASVARTATLREAAEALTSHGVAMLAVVGENREVVGMFGDEELLRAIFPAYLDEIRHTAFARDDVAALAERVRAALAEPVERHLCEGETVDADASATHVAERFLHCRLPALAVVRGTTFVGIVDRGAFARAMLPQARESGA